MQNGFLKPRTKSDLIVAATNGHARIHSESDNSNSLNSSHQSLGSSGGLGGGHHPTHFNTLPHPHHHQHSHANNSSTDPNAGSRTLKHHSTQQETRVTQIIRELQQMGPDGQQMDYSGVSGRGNTGNAQMADYGTTGYGTTPRPHYVSNPAQDHMTYDPMQDPYYGRGVLPPEADYMRQAGYPPTGYEEIDSGMVPPSRPEYLTPLTNTHPNNYGEIGVRWRDPDLHEVIQFLGNPNPVVKANAAAYLQHLCYMDDPVKTKTRVLGGIPPLVALLSHEQPEVHRNACGALRNLSYGRQNDENKKAIKSAGGIPSLVRLLKKTHDGEVKELVSGVLWNLSSCEELKKAIIDDGVVPLVNVVIIPHSGWDRNNVSGTSSNHIPDPCWSTVFKNASGVFRNISSAGEYARKKLRECEGLVEALLHVVRSALARAEVDDKSVENCVCILRNLSYRCQEVEDPNYDKHPPPLAQNRATAAPTAKGDNLGCFGAKKKKEAALAASSPKEGNSVNAGTGTTRSASQVNRGEPISGMELLWQPEVVQAYLALLSNCSNPETLEAAAGAIQNLAACYWQPSIEIRAAVRKEKGLPVLVELLRVEVDRVVCAVATALRNLAIDQRNKELIGKYAMRDLVQKLPSGRPFDQGASDDTIAAVLATLNEVIKKNAEFSGSLLEAEGVERLVFLTQQKRRFSPRVVKFASQVLYSLWQHQDNREVYKKAGWTEQDFVSKGSGGRSGSPGPGGSGTDLNSAGSPVNNANSTLNRPMASQSGTRYEDKTMQRGNNVPKSPPPSYPQGEEVPLGSAMPYPEGSHAPPPPGAFRMYPSPPVKPGEPLYAQVNREKKKNRGYEGPNSRGGYQGGLYNSSPLGEPTHSNWQESTNSVTHSIDNLSHQPAGDSWV